MESRGLTLRNSNPESRNSHQARTSKFQIRNFSVERRRFRISGFGLGSSFEFRVSGFLRAAAAVALAAAGCAEVPKEGVVDTRGVAGDPSAAIRKADASFAKDPRTAATVAQSLVLCEGVAAADSKNLDALRCGARAGVWLAHHESDAARKKAFALRALRLANSAAAAAPDRGECRYYRALAVGFLAQADSSYGPDAMKEMEADARKAAELDPKVDRAGPWRFLGNFYRETPGPPIGPGSVRKSLQCFDQAEALFPGDPENALYHGRSLREKGDLEAARAKWRGVLTAPPVPGKTTEQALWRDEARRELERP